MNESPSIFPPSSLDEVVERLLPLPDDVFAALKSDIRQHGFDARKDRCEALARLTGLTAETMAVLLSAFAFLYGRTSIMSPENGRAAIRGFVDSITSDALQGAAEKERLSVRVTELVAPSSEIDISRKVTRLKSGFLRNAVSFGSFVDVRADFEEGNEVIRGLVPLIQFRVTTDAESGSEKYVVFQIDPSGLKAMKDAVELAEKKLATLTKPGSLGPSFHKIAER